MSAVHVITVAKWSH